MACLSLVGSGRISLATTRLPTEQSFSTVSTHLVSASWASLATHALGHPSTLISRNEKKQIKQKCAWQRQFRLAQLHTTPVWLSSNRVAMVLRWLQVASTRSAGAIRLLDSQIISFIYDLFFIVFSFSAPSVPTGIHRNTFSFSFFFNYFPRRRLEQNQITEVPAKAFSAYKKLKRMWVCSMATKRFHLFFFINSNLRRSSG